MTKHTAPSGMTFELRTADQVPEGLRRPYVKRIFESLDLLSEVNTGTAAAETDADETEQELKVAVRKRPRADVLSENDDLDDLLAVALIQAWSLELPIEPASMLQLGKADYEYLRAVIAPFAGDLLPDFSPSPDPESPSTP